MTKTGIATALFVAGCYSWYSPGYNGIFLDPVSVSPGEGRIIAAILVVGAAIVWLMPSSKDG